MQEITGGFMKPPQQICTEGSPMLPNAAYVMAVAWRTDRHDRSDRVTTERSAVVTRPQSGLLGWRVYYPASEVARIIIGKNEA